MGLKISKWTGGEGAWVRAWPAGEWVRIPEVPAGDGDYIRHVLAAAAAQAPGPAPLGRLWVRRVAEPSPSDVWNQDQLQEDWQDWWGWNLIKDALVVRGDG